MSEFQSQISDSGMIRTVNKVRHLDHDDLGLSLPADAQDELTDEQEWDILREKANEVKQNSIGCAVVGDDQSTYTGVAVSTSTETVPPVVVAIIKATSDGTEEIKKAVLSSDDSEVGLDGESLQWLWEFGTNDTVVEYVTREDTKRNSISELYPQPYSLE